jgi:hypothetical protein
MTAIERRRQVRKLVRNYERDMRAGLRPFMGQQVSRERVVAMFDTAMGPAHRLVNGMNWMDTACPRVDFGEYLNQISNSIVGEVCDD